MESVMVAPPDPQDDFLENHRSFLNLLARYKLPAWLQPWVSPSDVVQETLKKALPHREELQPKPSAQVAVYLGKVLRSVLVDLARKYLHEKRNVVFGPVVTSSTNKGLQLPAEQTSPSEKVIGEELLGELSQALDQLPPRQRAAIERRYLQLPRCSLAKIARELDCTEKAAAALLCNALKRLRQLLRKSQ